MALSIGIDLRYCAASGMGTGSYAETSALDLAAAMGPSDAVWALAPRRPTGALARWPNVALVPDAANFGDHLLAERLLWDSAIVQRRIDVFFAPTGLAPLVRTCATVVTVHDLLFETRPDWFSPALLRYLKQEIPRSVRSADRVIAVSEHTRESLLRLYGVAPDRVHVVTQRLRDVFRAAPSRRRGEGGTPSSARPYVLTLSNHAPHKNTAFAIEVFARWRKARATPHELLIAGGGAAPAPPADLTDAIRRHQLTGDVRIVGRIEEKDLPALYAGADAFLYPSRYEGWGLPPLEAIAMGTPALVSDQGALPEAVGNAALVLPLDNVDAWVEALEACVRGPSATLREAMAARRCEALDPRGEKLKEIMCEAAAVWRGKSSAAVVATASPRPLPRVIVRGDFRSPSGEGETARLLCRALRAAGIDCRSSIATRDPTQRAQLWPEDDMSTGEGGVWLHTGPPHGYNLSAPGRHVGYLLSDTDRPFFGNNQDRSPWSSSLNRLDEIWVPSTRLVNVLHESGVSRPVRHLPIPVDTNVFAPGSRRLPGLTPPEGFDPTWTVFLYAGPWDRRTKADTLVHAFCRAFSGEDRALLVLQIFHCDEPSGGQGAMEDVLRRCATGTAHFRLAWGSSDAASLLSPLQSATVFVTAGCGADCLVPALFAMSCGAPVIAPKWSTFESLPVRAAAHRLVPVPPEVSRLDDEAERFWAVADEGDLAQHMQWAHRRRTEVREMGQRSREWVVANSSVPVFARIAGDALRHLAAASPTASPPVG